MACCGTQAQSPGDSLVPSENSKGESTFRRQETVLEFSKLSGEGRS